MDLWNAHHRSARSSSLYLSSSAFTMSKPVVIPSKGHRTRENVKPNDRHPGVPPAVAALLAVTTIPRPGSNKKSHRSRRRKAEDVFYGPKTPPYNDDTEDDVAILSDSDEQVYHSSSRAVLELLLSPPEDDEEYCIRPIPRSHSDSQLSDRTSSSESIPSLETDTESTLSFSSSFTSSRRRMATDPRGRIIAAPPEECDLDHPLIFPAEKQPPVTPETDAPFAFDEAIGRVTRRLNLKSNLTASIRVLKSAAKSFSSLTASTAALQPDDYLTRSILSITPTYRDERRPAPTSEIPTPAVRRYLNPWPATYDDSNCSGAVQMQTYNSSNGRRSGRSGRKGSKNTDEELPCACGPMVRQREVRENGDFLRVIVLEMNMRREGKLSDTAQGRARLVLPPRQPCKLRTAKGNPSRWNAWVCVYDE